MVPDLYLGTLDCSKTFATGFKTYSTYIRVQVGVSIRISIGRHRRHRRRLVG
jgi:hypothetical protein